MLAEMTNKEYREHEGISSTQIKRMAKSFAHFHYMEEHPDSNDSPALLFGRAVHKMCLEPYDFDKEFIVAPKVDKRTKEGKETWTKFLVDAEGKDVIDEEMYQQICDMRTSMLSTPFCSRLLNGEHEKSIFWEEDGLKHKCRPDSFCIVGNHIICTDIKTCQNAETEAFMRDSVKYSYDIQSAHYLEGLKAEYGDDYEYDFVFIAIEKTAPYLCNVLQADEYFLRSGRETRDALLEDYKECLKRGEWKGYMGWNDETSIGEMSLPAWMKKAFESEVSE